MFSFKTPRPGKTATKTLPQKRRRDDDDVMLPAPALCQENRAIPSIRRGTKPWSGETTQQTNQHFYTNNDERSIGLLSNLPPEVALLKNDIKETALDPVSGWIVVVARKTAFAWQAGRKSLPSCKQFPLPSDDCLVYIVPSSGEDSRLAGLLSVSRGGVTSTVEIEGQIIGDPNVVELRYWPDLTFASDTFKRLSVDLHEGDEAKSLINCEPAGYVLTTKMGVLYRIILNDASSGGLACEELSSRPTGMFARMGSLLGYNPFYTSSVETPEPVNAVRVVAGTLQPQFGKGGRDLFVVFEKSLAKWTLSRSQQEKFWYEADILDQINQRLAQQLLVDAVDAKILDAGMASDNRLCVLVSYPAMLENTEIQKYALLFLDGSFSGDSSSGLLSSTNKSQGPPIVDCKPLDVQRLADAAPPQLSLPNGGPLALLAFLDALVLANTWMDNQFEETIPLTHEGETKQILGTGTLDSSDQEAIVWALMRDRGVFELKANTEHIWRTYKEQDSVQGEFQRHTHQLKSLLEQALFYGKQEDNPISFKLDPASAGDLDVACLGLSADIVDAKSRHIADIVNVKMQLSDKMNRLLGLTQFLNSNQALDRLEDATRWTMFRDWQKVAAAQAMWQHEDSIIGSADWGLKPHLYLGSQAISAFFDINKIPRPEDRVKAMRQFFSFYNSKIDALFPLLLSPLTSRSSISGSTRQDLISMLKEAITLVLLPLEAGWDCLASLSQFGTTGLCPTEPWTASAEVLNTLQTLYELASDHLSRDSGNALKELFGRLGSALLRCYQERIDYLQSTVTASTTGAQLQPLQALKDVYADQRPKILTSLVRFGHRDMAYQLAETYQDFDKLAELVLAHENVDERDAAIRKHLDKFGTDFGSVVFEKYVGSGDFKTLLTQDDGYNQALTNFFQTRQLPAYAWLHHLRVKDFNSASKDLVAFAHQEANAGEKATALALAKLAAVVAKDDATNFDLPMELAQVNVSVQQDFAATLEKYREQQGRVPPDAFKARCDLALKLSKGKHLTHHPALAEVFNRLGLMSMRGDAVDVEDLLDIYTLRAKDGPEDFFDAFSMLAGMYTLIPAHRRQNALRTLWRRIVLFDKWDEISDKIGSMSDEMMVQELKKTSLYHVLEQSVIHGSAIMTRMRPSKPEDFLGTVDHASIEQRFGWASPEQVDAIWNDLTLENDQVLEYIRHTGLAKILQLILQVIEQ